MGAKCLRFQARAFVHFVVAIFDIAQHRVAQVGKVRADLVRAARNQPNAAQCKRSALPYDRHIGDDLLIAFALAGVDADLIVFLAVLQPGDMPPCGRGPNRDGQVFLFHQVIPDDSVQVTQGRVAFGGQHQSFGATVQPIAKRRGEPLLGVGVVLSLGFQVGGKRVHQVSIAGAVTVAQKVRRLVQHRKVGVLINHRHRRLTAGRFGLGLGTLGREELIIDVHLDQIACFQAGIRLSPFAVDLDTLVAKRLIHHAAGHVLGNALHKAAQADVVFIGTGGKTFHGTLTHLFAKSFFQYIMKSSKRKVEKRM